MRVHRSMTRRSRAPDVWMTPWRSPPSAAERMDLGPGVLVPSLRHPMVNATGAAALGALAHQPGGNDRRPAGLSRPPGR